MKPLLCNFGVMILLLGPFIIIPAMVIGFGLFLFGNEEVALWVCGTAAAVSLILGSLTFRTFAKWERKMPRSLRREAAIDVSRYRSKYKMMNRCYQDRANQPPLACSSVIAEGNDKD